MCLTRITSCLYWPRTDLTVHRSTDDGANWTSLPMVPPSGTSELGAPTGYSALTALEKGSQLGLLWEFVCCSAIVPYGVPMRDYGMACHRNSNTSIVWSTLPSVL
jgi:hypothetical protein